MENPDEKIYKLFDSRLKKNKEEKINIAQKMGFNFYSEAVWILHFNKFVTIKRIAERFNIKTSAINGLIKNLQDAISRHKPGRGADKKIDKICSYCKSRKVFCGTHDGIYREFYNSCLQCYLSRKGGGTQEITYNFNGRTLS